MGKKYCFSYSLKLVDTQMLIDSMRAKHCGSLYSHPEKILFHFKNRTERFITKHRRHFFAKWSSLTKQCLPTEETFNKLNANLPVASLLWSFSRTSSILDISLSTFCFASSNVEEVEVDMINVKTSGVKVLKVICTVMIFQWFNGLCTSQCGLHDAINFECKFFFIPFPVKQVREFIEIWQKKIPLPTHCVLRFYCILKVMHSNYCKFEMLYSFL